MLDPTYGPGVDAELDAIEFDDNRQKLWNDIVATIRFVLENPKVGEARQNPIRHPNGSLVWRVPIPSGQETENWSLLWQPIDDTTALIHYVGPWPPRQL